MFFCICLSTVTATLIVTMATNVDRHRYWLHYLKQQMQFLSLHAKLQSESPYDHIWLVALWTKPLNPTWKKMQWNNASSQMNEFWKKAAIFFPLTLRKSLPKHTIWPTHSYDNLYIFFFFLSWQIYTISFVCFYTICSHRLKVRFKGGPSR